VGAEACASGSGGFVSAEACVNGEKSDSYSSTTSAEFSNEFESNKEESKQKTVKTHFAVPPGKKFEVLQPTINLK
jgi:hypothetical protein